MDKVQKILSKIATRKLCTMDEHMAFYNDKAKEDYRFLSEIEELIKDLQEEPVSENLHEAAKAYSAFERSDDTEVGYDLNRYDGFIAGVEWKEQQMTAKAVDAVVSQVPCANEIILRNPESVHWSYLPQEMNKLGLNKGDKVKLIIVKED